MLEASIVEDGFRIWVRLCRESSLGCFLFVLLNLGFLARPLMHSVGNEAVQLWVVCASAKRSHCGAISISYLTINGGSLFGELQPRWRSVYVLTLAGLPL